jgi:hypothetical protein
MKLLLVALLLLVSLTNAHAADDSMQFSLIVVCPTSREPPCGNAMILARGRITHDTGARFESFLQSRSDELRTYTPSSVMFDSPGGSLYGGIMLGRSIRRAGFGTYLMPNISGLTLPAERLIRVADASCASACSLAFLGGTRRFSVDWRGRIGVHQFYSQGGNVGDSATQVTVTVIAKYIDEMGVDRGFLDIASLTPPQNMHWLTAEQQIRLRVDNTKTEPVEWRLTAGADGTPIAQVTQSFPANGSSCMAQLYTVRGRSYLRWVFRPAGGASSARDALSVFGAQPISVLVNEKDAQEESPGSLWKVNAAGALEAEIPLTPAAVALMTRARSIGLSVLASMVTAHLDPSCVFDTAGSSNLVRAALR